MTSEKRNEILDSIEDVVSLLIENNNIKFDDFVPIREAITKVEYLVLGLDRQ